MVDGFLANWHLSHILHFGLHFRSNLKGSLMGWKVKNLLSCQSKQGLAGSSTKTGNFLSRESQEWKTCTFWGSKHKSAICVLYVCRRAQGSQMSSGVFTGKEISKRIDLSQLVQVSLFWVLPPWGLGGWWMGVWVGGGNPMHVSTCMCTHIIISCKWLPPWRNPWEFPMMSYVHACAHPYPLTHPSAPYGGTPRISKNWIKLEWIFSRYFDSVWRFWICGDSITHGWVYGLVGGWVIGGFMGQIMWNH